ncbi:unnamed protein product, partial [Onchocerca ochengi]
VNPTHYKSTHQTSPNSTYSSQRKPTTINTGQDIGDNIGACRTFQQLNSIQFKKIHDNILVHRSETRCQAVLSPRFNQQKPGSLFFYKK